MAAAAIVGAAYVAAFVIVLWILMYLLDANRGNEVVDLVHDAASWLTGWSRDLFTVEPDWWRMILNYGIAAVAYLFAGHLLSYGAKRY